MKYFQIDTFVFSTNLRRTLLPPADRWGKAVLHFLVFYIAGENTGHSRIFFVFSNYEPLNPCG